MGDENPTMPRGVNEEADRAPDAPSLRGRSEVPLIEESDETPNAPSLKGRSEVPLDEEK